MTPDPAAERHENRHVSPRKSGAEPTASLGQHALSRLRRWPRSKGLGTSRLLGDLVEHADADCDNQHDAEERQSDGRDSAESRGDGINDAFHLRAHSGNDRTQKTTPLSSASQRHLMHQANEPNHEETDSPHDAAEYQTRRDKQQELAEEIEERDSGVRF